MSKVIVIQFITLDGVTEDPDGSGGFRDGGWMFRFPDAVGGDKFKLGPLFNSGTLLLGRRTWELFARIWPTRSDEFSNNMNRVRKLVVSNTLKNLDAWNNSSLLSGDLIEEVRGRGPRETLIVVGSDSVVQQLRKCDLVDEYRLLTLPIVIGHGRRLFPEGVGQTMRVRDVMQSGEGILAYFDVARSDSQKSGDTSGAGALEPSLRG
jgi:dihydrofolate reductase